jgi:hypothetical protein
MLRLLARAAPFLLAAVAAAIWLRRRAAELRAPERPALPMKTGPVPVRAFERARIDIVTVVDDLLGAAP